MIIYADQGRGAEEAAIRFVAVINRLRGQGVLLDAVATAALFSPFGAALGAWGDSAVAVHWGCTLYTPAWLRVGDFSWISGMNTGLIDGTLQNAWRHLRRRTMIHGMGPPETLRGIGRLSGAMADIAGKTLGYGGCM